MIRRILTLVSVLMIAAASPSLAASVIGPAFGKFTSAGMSVDAGKSGTNTMHVIGATFSKPGGKPTMTITGDSTVVKTSGDQTIGGTKTFSSSIVSPNTPPNRHFVGAGGYASLAAAVTALGSTPATLEFSADQPLSADLATPTTLELLPLNGAKIIHGSYTISYAGSTARWPLAQIFDGTGAVTGLKEARPEWFYTSGDYALSINKAIFAVSAGGMLTLQHGKTYTISSTVSHAYSNVHLNGNGATLKASVGMASTMLIVGNKVDTAVTSKTTTRNLILDASDLAITGLEFYGLRDGSQVSHVYVKDNTTVPGIIIGQAGGGTGTTALKMCEGVNIENTWVIGGPWANGIAWQIDGINESQMFGGGVRGYSIDDNFNATGIALGMNAEVRGLTLYGATVVMLKGASGGNVGLRYGQWTRDCSDYRTTFEGITGSGVYFHGSTASGVALPFDCRSVAPRLYNSGEAGVLDPAIKFGVASSCSADVRRFDSDKVWARFDGESANGQNANTIEIESTATDPENVLSTIVSMDADSASSNTVAGMASSTSTRKRVFLTKSGGANDYFANGAFFQHDVNRSMFKLPAANELQIRDKDNNTLVTLVANRLKLSNVIPAYADNAAALAGGLTAGHLYRTSAGGLMIVY